MESTLFANTTANADRSFTVNCVPVGNPNIAIVGSTVTVTLADED